jgi:glutaredoxin
METITVYSAGWCPDCWRTKKFLKERGLPFQEVNIEEDLEAEELVLRVNHGRRRIPTLQIGDRFLVCSPFNAQKLADELRVPLNP